MMKMKMKIEKKIYFIDKACITVNFIVSKIPNEHGINNAKEKLENFLCEGNNLFIDKTIVLDDNADDSNSRNENPKQEQNNFENDINNINIINHGQTMEEDPKIEDDKWIKLVFSLMNLILRII